MLTLQERRDLKRGDKLIFVNASGTLSGRPGEVWTFYGFYTWEMSHKNSVGGIPEHWKPDFSDGKLIQLQEQIDAGNFVHNYSYEDLEVFDPAKHKEFRMMSVSGIHQAMHDFTQRYGD